MTDKLKALAFLLVFSTCGFSQETNCQPPTDDRVYGGFQCEEEVRPHFGAGRVFIFRPPASVVDYFEVSGTVTLAPNAENVPGIPDGGAEPFLRVLSSERDAEILFVQPVAAPLAIAGMMTDFVATPAGFQYQLPVLLLDRTVRSHGQTLSFAVIWRRDPQVEHAVLSIYIDGTLYHQAATFDGQPAPVRLGRVGLSPSHANSMSFRIHRAH